MTTQRTEILALADALLGNARTMARCYADADGRLAAHIRDTHSRRLRATAQHYRDAGLSLLAGRVAWLAQQENVVDAWEKFDRLNAGGCGVA